MKELAFFILPLILAIPIGIFSNLLTPHIKNWWAKSSAGRARKRLVKINAEYEKVSRYFHSKEDLIIYISITALESLLRFGTGFLAPLVVDLYSSMFPKIRLFESELNNYYFLLFILSLSYFFCGRAIYNIFACSNIARKVMDFEKYEQKVNKLKQTLEKIADSPE